MKLIMPQGVKMITDINDFALKSGCICHSGSQDTKQDFGFNDNCGCSCINENTVNRSANHNLAYS